MDKDRKESKGPVRRIIKKLLIAVACGFLLAVIGLGIMIAPDQFGSVSAPPVEVWLRQFENAQWERAGSDTVAGIAGDATAENGLKAAKVETSISPASIQNEAGIDAMELDELLRKWRPFPNIQDLPEDVRDCADRLNTALDKAAIGYRDLIKKFKGMEYDDAPMELSDILDAHLRTLYETMECMPHEYRDQLREALQACMSIYYRIGLLISVENGEWQEAAGFCARLCTTLDPFVPDKNSRWWLCEVYCRRQSGLRGRGVLALRSTGRIWWPSVLSFGEAIESQFQWLDRRF